MSATTEDLFILDSDDRLVGDNPKVEKKTKGSFESAARKRLGDISNLPQRPKPSTKDEKEQFVSNTTKEYIEHLKKYDADEAFSGYKVFLNLVNSKIIEFSGIELQKLRINFQKMRQQNFQLAQSNSQMLTELNSEKDRLKVLQPELGSKNALLNAKKLELKEKAEITCQYTDKQEGTSKSEEARESSEADRADNECFKTKKRQQSKIRQSAGFKPAEPEPTEEAFEIGNAKFPVCSLHDDQMQEDGSTSTCSSAKTDDKRGISGPSDDEAACLRSQSARSKHQESEPTDDTFEIDDTKFPVYDKSSQKGSVLQGNPSKCEDAEKRS
ncbi:unnamed protein product [Camellia sinensis]